MNIRKPDPEEMEGLHRAYKWAHHAGNVACGIPFDDPLVNIDGIAAILLVPNGTDPALIEKAKSKIRNDRDVVYFRAIAYDPPKVE